MFDLVIKGARVVDGTGAPAYVADVGVDAGQITVIGRLANAEAPAVVDADRLVLTPGFVDVHTHSDFALLYNPPAQSHAAQGITSEVIGNCGYSAFPRVATNHGFLLDPPGVDGSWTSAADFFQYVHEVPTGVNAVSLVGHTTIRAAVVGRDDRPATAAELARMKDYVREALDAGAVGLSTGLDYAPGASADTAELIALCEVVAECGGIYASHLRGYADTVVAAVNEALAIGRAAGVPVQLSHLHAFGRANWGVGNTLVDAIEAARGDGVDVTADVLAYPTVGAWWGPRAVFADEVYDWRRGNVSALASLRAALHHDRAGLRTHVERRRTIPKHGFHEVCGIFSDWRDIYITSVSEDGGNTALLGRSVAELAESQDREPVDVYFDLIEEEGERLGSVHITQHSDDFDRILRADWCMVSTDTVATSLDRLDEPFNVLQQHPRGWATYPRVLRTFVQDRRVLSLEEAVRKITSLPAARFRLGPRGVISKGMAADLVLFDPDEIEENASYLAPTQHPTGIRAVFVNGKRTVNEDGVTGATPASIRPVDSSYPRISSSPEETHADPDQYRRHLRPTR